MKAILARALGLQCLLLDQLVKLLTEASSSGLNPKGYFCFDIFGTQHAQGGVKDRIKAVSMDVSVTRPHPGWLLSPKERTASQPACYLGAS